MVFTDARKRRADQICRQCVSRDQDHVHQRDRRSVRGGRRRCAGHRPRHRARRPHRPQVPACRPRLRRFVLPEGLPGAGAHRRDRQARRWRSSIPSCGSTTRASAAWRDRIAEACGGDVAGKTLAVLGLTFKPNTDDMRDSPSLSILPALHEAGATIRAFDPEGMDEARKLMPELDYFIDAYEAMQGADALVLITEWNEFRGLDLAASRSAARAARDRSAQHLQARRDDEAGLVYHSIGRPPPRERPSLRAIENPAGLRRSPDPAHSRADNTRNARDAHCHETRSRHRRRRVSRLASLRAAARPGP